MEHPKWFICPECDVSIHISEWNRETANAFGIYAPLPLGAVKGWKHKCPECKLDFEGDELIPD